MIGTEVISIRDANIGDRLYHTGVLFEITGKRVEVNSTSGILARDEYGPAEPRFLLDTRLVDYPAGSPMPRHWAETWVFAGNELARFARVTQ